MEIEVLNYSKEKLKSQKKSMYIVIFITAIFMVGLNLMIANGQAEYDKISFSEAFNLRLTIAMVILVFLVMLCTSKLMFRVLAIKSIILQEDKFTYISIKSGGLLSGIIIGRIFVNLFNALFKIKKEEVVMFSQIKEVKYYATIDGEVKLIRVKHHNETIQIDNIESMNKIFNIIKSKVSIDVNLKRKLCK